MKEQIPVIKKFYSLGTIIELQAYGDNAEHAIYEASERLSDIDDKMSVFKEYSEISKINNSAGISMEKVSKETFFVISKAVHYGELYQGVMDITVRPLMNLWAQKAVQNKVPSNDEINSMLKRVNYKDIILSEKQDLVMLKHENQALDLGCIAKGYAADVVKNIFMKNGVSTGLLDLGGNIVALGNKIDGTKWNIGIQDPFKRQGEYIGIISVANKSVVTSGNYERYFIYEGKKYHHIIDPTTGYPCSNGVVSTTIISDNSIDGDALSTCTYILGVEKGLKLIELIKDVDAIFITEQGQVYTTSGVKIKK